MWFLLTEMYVVVTDEFWTGGFESGGGGGGEVTGVEVGRMDGWMDGWGEGVFWLDKRKERRGGGGRLMKG